MNANQIVTELQQLIAKGEQIAPHGGASFTGYNGKGQSEYAAWRISAISVIEELGQPAKRMLKEIEEDRQGKYFYESSATHLLGILKGALVISQRNVNTQRSENEHQKSPQMESIQSLQRLENTGKVFVIHGRNEKLRASLFEFLRALHVRPIEWIQAKSMTGKGSPYVGEILDAAFLNAHAVIALMSGDDEARLCPTLAPDEPAENLTPQARANVIFEAGMAMGRNPDRVVIVEVGTLRAFSDISGRHTVRLNNSPERRKELAELLRTMGCAVDMSGTDWLRSGDFSDGAATRNP